jgi:dethiobiotin synthase
MFEDEQRFLDIFFKARKLQLVWQGQLNARKREKIPYFPLSLCFKLFMQFFITGTDTNVGKTWVSAWLCHHLKANYFKPIQSGTQPETDLQFIQRLCPKSKIFPPVYSFENPLSPHLAAKIEGQYIDIQKIALPKQLRLIVEGAGGVLVPVNEKHCIIDVIKQLEIPVIVVARNSLGTINHTCLTLAALRARQITVFGVVLNGGINEDHKAAIEHYGQSKVLAQIPFLQKEKEIYDIPLPNLAALYADAAFSRTH